MFYVRRPPQHQQQQQIMKQRRTSRDSSSNVPGGGVLDADVILPSSFSRSMSVESSHNSGPDDDDVRQQQQQQHQVLDGRRRRLRRNRPGNRFSTGITMSLSSSNGTSTGSNSPLSSSPTLTAVRRQGGGSNNKTATSILPPLRMLLLLCPLSFFCSLILSSWVLSCMNTATPSTPGTTTSVQEEQLFIPHQRSSHHAVQNNNNMNLQQQQYRRIMREERRRQRKNYAMGKRSESSSTISIRSANTVASSYSSSSFLSWWSSWWWRTWLIITTSSSTTFAQQQQQRHHHPPDNEEEKAQEEEDFEEWINVIDMRNLSYELPFHSHGDTAAAAEPDNNHDSHHRDHHYYSGSAWKQGWELKPVPLPLAAAAAAAAGASGGNNSTTMDEDDVLQIFVVPHSHVDPGWIKTVDEYYTDQVEHILDTIVVTLRRDIRRKFIWGEVVFLQRWWLQQNTTQRELLKDLIIKSRQLELVTGSWVSPDEANTNFYALQVQLQEGYDWLVETFGGNDNDNSSSLSFLPEYAWSLDPFGYSSTLAYLLTRSPYKKKIRGLVIQRVHYAVKQYLAKHQHLEFYWRQTWDNDNEKSNNNNTEENSTHPYNATTTTRRRRTLTNHHDIMMVDFQQPSERHRREQNDVNIVDDDELQPHPYDLLTHILPFYSYDVPHSCGPDPSVCCQFDFARLPMQHKHGSGGSTLRRQHQHHQDNKRPCPWGISPVEITEQNVQERALLLLDQYRKKASLHRSGKLVLAPLGDDFRFQTIHEAELQFQNYQKIMTYIQDNVPGVHMQFGTLRDYFQAVERYQERFRQRQQQPQQREQHQQQGQKPEMSTMATPILKGSFLSPPYADVDEAYWSGYYSSRMSDKAMIRRLERTLYAAERLGATRREMQLARRTLSLVQHHDAITGTAESFVVQDYANKIHGALQFTQNWMRDYILQTHYYTVTTTITNEGMSKNTTATRAIPGTSSKEDPALFLKPCWQYTAPRGQWRNFCDNQVESNDKQPKPVVVVYNPLETEDQECGNVIVPPGEIRDAVLPCEIMPWRSTSLPKRQQQQHETSPLRIVFDPYTGLMTEPIREEWMVWRVNKGGAYLFYPSEQGPYDLAANNHQILHGGLVVQTQKWNRTVIEKQVPIFDSGTTATVIDFIFETHLEEDNCEWFVRFYGNVANRGVFHTDLNGFNFDTHRYRSDMPIQSQVHPMPNMASIEDNHTRMTILSEHAQGAASLQDGTIDVWIDRRLAQDDARGLGQGIQDNAPTQTRLRLVLEEGNGFDSDDESLPFGEFQPTKLVQRMWDQLQHPLLIFGNHAIDMSEFDQIADPVAFEKAALERRARREEERREMGNFDSENIGQADHDMDRHQQGWSVLDGALMNFGSSDAQQINQLSQRSHHDDYARSRLQQKFDGGFHGSGALQFKPRSITSTRFSGSSTNVIFVYMVFKRVDYLKKAIESLTKSDYPRERLPLIISHDGHVPEVVQYVETLKKDYNIIQLFHPFSCYEHPDSFPGDDKKLNDGYKGDRFGRPRSPWATCCKHHFTWMVNQVFRLDFGPNLAVDTFLFMEEDYLVAPTVYQAIVAGLNVLDNVGGEAHGGFLGLGLDPTNADKKTEPFWLEDTWHAEVFATGPMTLNRSVFAQLKAHADAYCTVDEYNWDWSLVHLGGIGYFPHTVLAPARVLAKHIGTTGGMHTEKRKVLEDIQERYPEQHQDDQEILHHSLRQRKAFDTLWAGKRVNGNLTVLPRKHAGYGGWGHPADQEHCLKLFHG